MSQAQIQSFLSQQQIEQTLAGHMQAERDTNGQQNGNGSNGTTNLNNSTASSHMNVYKPTFIINKINNSYQPEHSANEKEEEKGDKKKTNGTHGQRKESERGLTPAQALQLE